MGACTRRRAEFGAAFGAKTLAPGAGHEPKIASICKCFEPVGRGLARLSLIQLQ